MILGEQQFRRIAYLTQTVLTHLVDAQFGSASETVLYASQYSVHIMLVAFELKYRINDMFQYFWSGDASFLVDMTNQYDRSSGFLGKSQYCCRAFSHLYYASGR